jgi:hypothetical protein
MHKQLQDKVFTQPPPLTDQLGREEEAKNRCINYVRRKKGKLEPPLLTCLHIVGVAL